MNNYYDPNSLYRQFSLTMPGLDTGVPMLDMALSFFGGRNVFPQPTGNYSIQDMMHLRSRSESQRQIVAQAFADNQMFNRLGGLSPTAGRGMLQNFLGHPQGAFWDILSPIVGGNAAQAQLGLYADLTGYAAAGVGLQGNISAAQTQQLMDQLTGQFYKKPDFGRYVNNVRPLIDSLLSGPDQRALLDRSWDASTLENLEGLGYTSANRGLNKLLDRTLDRVAKAESPEEQDKLRNKATEAAEKFLDGVVNPEAKRKLRESFAEAIKTGGAEAFREAWAVKGSDLQYIVARGIDLQEGRVPGSINYEFTRGFLQEDITGAYGIAARSGLMSNSRTASLDGLRGMTGAMDAARGLFGGDLSGRELMKELNNLIGSGSIDMANPADAQKLEQLLRNVKSMARVAGVNIESMKGIVAETQGLAARHSGLPFGISGLTAMQYASQAVGGMTAGMGELDPSLVRRMGGPTGLVRAQEQGIATSLAEPITQQLAALYHRASTLKGQDSPLAKRILDFATNPEAAKSAANYNRFIREIAPSFNANPHALMHFASTSPVASNLGIEMQPALVEAGKQAQVETLMQYAGRQLGVGTDTVNWLFQVGMDPKNNAGNLDELREEAFRRVGRNPAAFSQISQFLDAANKGKPMGLSDIASALGISDRRQLFLQAESAGLDLFINPRARARHEAVKQQVAVFSELEGAIAGKFAEVQAPLMQRFIQGAIDGKFDDSVFGGIKDIITGGHLVGKSADEVMDLTSRIEALTQKDSGRLRDAVQSELKAKGIEMLFPASGLKDSTPENLAKFRELFPDFKSADLGDNAALAKMLRGELAKDVEGRVLFAHNLEVGKALWDKMEERGSPAMKASLATISEKLGGDKNVYGLAALSESKRNELLDSLGNDADRYQIKDAVDFFNNNKLTSLPMADNPLANQLKDLDIQGVIDAITELTSALTKASSQ